MSRINEVITGIKNKNYALISFLIILVGFFGIIWLALLKVDAGYLYLLLLVGFTTILFILGKLFIKEEDMKFYLSLPFSKNNGIGSVRFYMGFLVPFIIKAVLGLFAISFTIVPPLLIFNAVQGGQQTFSALAVQQSSFFSLFNIVFVAGGWEEFILAPLLIIPLIVIGYLIVLAINKWTNNSINLKSTYTKIGVYSFAFLVSIVFFAILHSFNPSYTTTGQFIIAAGFRLLMNALMFFFVGIEFTIGLHMANNLLYLLSRDPTLIFKSLTSNFFGTLALIGVFVLILSFAIIEIRDIFKDSKPFDRFMRLFSMKS